MEAKTKTKAIELIEGADLKPTPNRILVTEALLEATAPMSLIELETQLQTVERSSLLRSLQQLVRAELLHVVEDGRGVAKYEMCQASEHSVDDMHPHFFCTRCHRTYCLDDMHLPSVTLPEGFTLTSANYMLKGICPKCS